MALSVSANLPCGAQTVDLQGTVTDRYGSKEAIPDADVTLIKAGLTARTDAAGKFHLQSAPTGLAESNRPGMARWVPGRGLIFRNPRAGNVSIGFMDPAGRVKLRIADARLDAGLWSFYPSGLADGIYLLLLRTPDSRAGIPIMQLGRGGADAPPGYCRMDAAVPSGLAKVSGVLDSIKVVKAGYFAFGQAIAGYVQSDLALNLADTSSNLAGLKALFPSSGTLQPNFDPLVLNYALAVRESVSEMKFTPIAAPNGPYLYLQNGYDVSKTAAGVPSDPIGLKTGHNPIRVLSMSRDSAQMIYYDIDILRVNDTLAGLTGLISAPAGFTPAFSPNQFVYTLAMPAGATAISLTPTAPPFCALRVRGNPVASGQTSLPMTVRAGTDTVPVEVWSPNNLVKATYRVITTRPMQDTSSLPVLASLTVTPAGGFSPAFDPAVTTYHAWYPGGPSPLKIVAVASNPAMLVTLPGRPPVLSWDSVTISPDSGNFSYDFKVATADGLQSKTYTLGVSKGTDRTSTLNQIHFSPAYALFTPTFSANFGYYDVTMKQKDSLVTVTSLPDRIAATTFYNGAVIPNLTGYPMSIKPWPQVTTLDIVVIAQDGVTKSSYRFSFKRYPPLGVPQVNAPSAGLKDTAYLYSQVLPSGCVIGSKVQAGLFGYQMDFGDGTAPVTGSHGLSPLLDDIHRAYKAAGTFAIKVRSFCNFDTSAWSPPSPITIYDTAASAKVRLITGPHSVSETWYKDTTYLITGKTLFEKAATLTIQPGTHVSFTDTGNYLQILGGLSAVGTATDSIRFDQANLRISWTSTTGGTFNPDGSYLAGPRLEYCAIDRALSFPDGTGTNGGGWGAYLKNSRVRTITGDFFKAIKGSYIDHCRIDFLDGMDLSKSRVLNSHIVTASIIAGKGSPVTVQRCDFGYTLFHSGDFTDSDISGNTFHGIGFGNGTPGKMQGNNILPGPSTQIRAGTGIWDMQGNFWGDAGAAEMNAKGANQNIGLIYDYLDDVGLGKLDYSNWKTALIPDAMPDWP